MFPSFQQRRRECNATSQQRRRRWLLFPSPGRCPGGQRRGARRALASDWPGGPCTQSRRRSPGPQRFLPAPPPAPTGFGPQGTQAEEAAAATTTTTTTAAAAERKRRPRMLLSDSPYAERPQRARPGLCAAPASRRWVGARHCLSPRLRPFAALPSSATGPTPALLAAPGSAAAFKGALPRRCLGRYPGVGFRSPCARLRGRRRRIPSPLAPGAAKD